MDNRGFKDHAKSLKELQNPPDPGGGCSEMDISTKMIKALMKTHTTLNVGQPKPDSWTFSSSTPRPSIHPDCNQSYKISNILNLYKINIQQY